ncbi:MAG: PIN domain-containing protein [Candidatus Limnocylindrales bacterium]
MYLLLDSTFLIDLLRGDPAARIRLGRIYEDGDDPYLNDVVLCEVRTGLLPKDVGHFEEAVRYLGFVQPGPDVATRAGEWRADSRRHGRVLSLGDALIASAAHSLKGAVLTRNVCDFAQTPVRVESY